MEQIKVIGAVLSAAPAGEYDRRLVILTDKKGKITAFARGARKQTGALLAGGQPMTFGHFTLTRGRSAYTVTGFKPIKYFAPEMTEMNQIAYGMYFLELAGYYGREGLEAEEMLNLLYYSLKAVLAPSVPDRLIRVAYELRLMSQGGDFPGIFTCASCGGNSGLDAFDPAGRGMLCKKCHTDFKGIVRTRPAALYAMQYIVTAPLSKLYTFTVTPEVLSNLEEIVTPYLHMISDKKFQSEQFIEST